MKKIILILAAPLALGHFASAQSPFEFDHKEISTSTPGTDPDDIYDELIIPNKLKNTSEATFKYKWRLINPDERPTAWTLSGFCDNYICYTSGWQAGEEKESLDLDPGAVSDFKLQLKIPQGIAVDATAAFKFEAKVGDYADTATFIVIKGTTSVEVIPVDDTRVNIFPNPSNEGFVNVYVAAELNATKVYAYNMLGQIVATVDVNNEEFHKLDVSNFAAGVHHIQIVNNENKVLTSRKFLKH